MLPFRAEANLIQELETLITNIYHTYGLDVALMELERMRQVLGRQYLSDALEAAGPEPVGLTRSEWFEKHRNPKTGLLTIYVDPGAKATKGDGGDPPVASVDP